MANETVVAIDFLKGGASRGPVGSSRLAVDASGNPIVSVDGADFSALGGASFGPDTVIQLPNSAAALVQALELINEWRVNTAGSEESRWRVFLRALGAEIEGGGFAINGTAFPMVYIGPLANNNGFRPTASNNIDVLCAGAAPFSFSSTANNAHSDLICESSLYEASQGGTISTNTLTKSIGNIVVVPGTPTINGITTTGITKPIRVLLKCASGTTLVHNSGSPGSGAVKLLNVSGSNITTTSTRMIPYVLDLTDNVWYQEG